MKFKSLFILILGFFVLLHATPLVYADADIDNAINFIITKQDSNGGFGFSAPGCPWYETSADMTGAGIQALKAAKDNGLTNTDLATAITKAKDYLLSNQNADGGFGYYGSSDADTTGWVLMAFNVLGEKDTTPAINTKDWLLTKQSNTDGGFLTYDFGANAYVSNSTTTAQALTALAGKGWILQIFAPSTTPSPIPTATSSATPSSTSTPVFSPTATPAPSATVSPTATPTPTPSPIPTITHHPSPKIINLVKKPLPSPSPEVLGVITTPSPSPAKIVTEKSNKTDALKRMLFSLTSFLSFAGAALYWKVKC